MSLSVRAMFRSMDDYPHIKNIPVFPDEECLCCRDTYSQNGSSSKCRPIRLRACNHFIGDQCFREWIQRHPDTCPYWSHPLSPISRQTDRTYSLSHLLNAYCSTEWFDFKEQVMNEIITGPLFIRIIVRNATRALLSDRLMLVDAGLLFVAFALGNLVSSIILMAILLFFLFFIFALCLVLNACFELSFPMLVVLRVCLNAAWYIAVIEAISFQMVIFCVLGLGYWRSWKHTGHTWYAKLRNLL